MKYWDISNLCKSVASRSLFVQVVFQKPLADVFCHFNKANVPAGKKSVFVSGRISVWVSNDTSIKQQLVECTSALYHLTIYCLRSISMCYGTSLVRASESGMELSRKTMKMCLSTVSINRQCIRIHPWDFTSFNLWVTCPTFFKHWGLET